MSKSIDISLTPSQNKFLQLEEPYTLFCAGMGSGKSYLMGLMVVLDAMHGDDATIGVYEPEKKHIRTVAVPNVEHWLTEFGIKYRYNKNDSVIYVDTPGVGDIMFFPMDNPDTLVGYQTYRAHIDELDTLPEEKAESLFRRVLQRNRAQPKNLKKEELQYSETNQRWEAKNKIRSYSTPEGFRFCYKRWKANPNDSFAMVKGKTIENPAVSESYIKEMTAGLTKEQARAYLEGEFINLTSGTVYYAYNRESHDSVEHIRPGEALFIGCDFNVNKQAATVYVKREGGKEWHAVEEFCDMRDTPEMIRIFEERYISRGHKITVYPDSSGGHRKSSDASTTDLALLSQAGFNVRAKKTNPRVKDRVLATNKAFEDRKLFVNQRACPTTAACFEQQSYNQNGEPDKSNGHDHQNDASTYPIAYEMGITKKAWKIPFSFAF